MKRREITMPTIVGLLVAISGLISGLWVLQGRIRQTAQADTQEAPSGAKITNVSDTSFTVSWVTEKAVAGFVKYGEGSDQPHLIVSDERDQQKGAIGNYFTHFVPVRGLKPTTEYTFTIGSGNGVYDNGGEMYRVNTGPALNDPPAADVAYGQVVTASGEPAEGAMVYVSLAGMAPQAALVRLSGSWVVPLSTARNENLQAFVDYDSENAQVEVFVQGGPLGSSTVVVSSQNDSPVPTITLGQTYDFTAEKPAVETEAGSKFSAEALSGVTEGGGDLGLKLLTPKFGENVNTARPEIIGEAPAGTEIVVEIRSETPITRTVKVGRSGRFNFSTPTDLSPGEHTVTITAVIDGVSRRITRSFTVYAAGESTVPIFTATPSGTLTPAPSATRAPTATQTPRPTTGPQPTLNPSPTVGITATPAVTVAPTSTIKPSPTPKLVSATDSALPESGYETPTVILLLIGVAMVLTGGWWYRRAV